MLIGGFTNGLIKIYNCETSAKMIEIAAHARYINAMDVAVQTGLVRFAVLHFYNNIIIMNNLVHVVITTTTVTCTSNNVKYIYMCGESNNQVLRYVYFNMYDTRLNSIEFRGSCR